MHWDTCYIAHRTLSTSLHCFAKLLFPTRSTFSNHCWRLSGCANSANRTWYSSISAWRLITHTILWCAADLAACACRAWDLWQVLYRPASALQGTLSTQITPCETGDTCLHFIRPVAFSFSNPYLTRLITEFGRNVAAALPDESLWRWWTEAARWLARGLKQSIINDAINEWRKRVCEPKDDI